MEEDRGEGLVLVTGATGFVAGHVISLLQKQGYRVRGTMRDTSNAEKSEKVKNICPDAPYEIELVQVDLMDDVDHWREACKGCKYVIHVASPFPSAVPKDENELIKPAVHGATTVIKAAALEGVQRVVLTSSVAAIYQGNPPKVRREKIFTEEDWSIVERLDRRKAYPKSKTLAEQAAWKLVESLPPEETVELVVLNPSYIVGPLLHKTNCTSAIVPVRLLKKEMPGIPNLCFGINDVRDLARAHVVAMTHPNAPGNRFIVSHSPKWFSEIAQIYAQEFGPQGYIVPTRKLPKPIVWLASWWDDAIAVIYPDINFPSNFSNEKIKSVLGFEFEHDPKDSLIDMAYSLIELGMIEKKPGYKPRGSTEDSADSREGHEGKEEIKDEEEIKDDEEIIGKENEGEGEIEREEGKGTEEEKEETKVGAEEEDTVGEEENEEH